MLCQKSLFRGEVLKTFSSHLHGFSVTFANAQSPNISCTNWRYFCLFKAGSVHNVPFEQLPPMLNPMLFLMVLCPSRKGCDVAWRATEERQSMVLEQAGTYGSFNSAHCFALLLDFRLPTYCSVLMKKPTRRRILLIPKYISLLVNILLIVVNNLTGVAKLGISVM